MSVSCQSQQQKVFLEGYEVKLNGDDQCRRFFKTQAISEELVQTSVDALELVFEEGKLTQKFFWSYGDRDEVELTLEEKGMAYIPVVPHDFYIFKTSDTGSSYLGGDLPTNFKLPKFEERPSLQFLGTLSSETVGLEWLPFDLHLAVPIYGNFYRLFMDYSDPLNPKVWNPEEYLETGYEDEWVKHDTKLIFEQKFMETEKMAEMPEIHQGSSASPGHLGIPQWIQGPDIPDCPKTNKTMKFVAQFSYGLDVKLAKTNLDLPTEGYYADLLNRMNFWSDGDLYIFMNPESKMVCYIIQHT
jgi:hypothetical protein